MKSTDTLAHLLARDPWATPLGLASQAVSRAEEALECLRAAPDSRRELRPRAVAQLVRARRFVLDARGLLTAQVDREQLVYLGELLDVIARALGFLPGGAIDRAVA